MTDYLNEAEIEKAKTEGWQLCDVFDLATKAWRVEVLPTPNNELKSAFFAQQSLIERARCRDVLATKALTVVMQSLQPRKKK